MALLSELSSIISDSSRKIHFLLLLFILTFIFRAPTLFNDYYDVDELSAIVQTQEYIAGDMPGKDFEESKLPLYHLIFKFSYAISAEKGWVVVHAATILIIFFTSFFIYLIASGIRDHKTGTIAAILYALLISSFNRHFMATNGEIVFNLPISGGLYFFSLYLSRSTFKRYIYLFSSCLMGLAAMYVKFHGIIFFITMGFFFIIYYPFYKNKFNLKYLLFLLSFVFIILIILILDYFFSGSAATALLSNIKDKLLYAAVKGKGPLNFIIRFIHRQGMLLLWHSILWLPIVPYLREFIKTRFRGKDITESFVFMLFIFTYLMIFGGGSRLYFHYFMAVYPALCIISSIALFSISRPVILFLKAKAVIFLLIPSLFFLTWNTKDIIIKHFYPDAFYNEGKILYWIRAVLVGTFDDYLLPNAAYKDACLYIKEASKPGDRIFVWGDGPYLYYFSERRMGTRHMWPKTSIIRINQLYKSMEKDAMIEAENMEKHFIAVLESKKPVLFIDTSKNGLSTFNYPLTPLIKSYIREKYNRIKEVNNIDIYSLKSKN